MMRPPSPVTAKATLRAGAAARRDELEATLGATAPAAVLANFLATPELVLALTAGPVCAGYAPIGSELDPGPLIRHLCAVGLDAALPVTQGRGRPLLFRRWRWGEALVLGAFGVQVPPPENAVVEPALLLVPLLAFDAAGYRLGYGAGYYDLTLAALRARRRVVAVGLAFAGQRVEVLPRDAHDQAVDWIVTEAGAAKFR